MSFQLDSAPALQAQMTVQSCVTVWVRLRHILSGVRRTLNEWTMTTTRTKTIRTIMLVGKDVREISGMLTVEKMWRRGRRTNTFAGCRIGTEEAEDTNPHHQQQHHHPRIYVGVTMNVQCSITVTVRRRRRSLFPRMFVTVQEPSA